MSGPRNAHSSDEDDLSTIRNRSRTTSDVLSNSDDSSSDGAGAGWSQGSYSARMVEVLSDGDRSDDGIDEVGEVGEQARDNEDDEAFLYSGRDAEPAAGYQAQLKDVLDNEMDSEDELQERELVSESKSLSVSVPDEALGNEGSELALSSELSISPPPEQFSDTFAAQLTTGERVQASSFIHPSVSRLRSILPGQEQMLPSQSYGASSKTADDSLTSPYAPFSSASRSSSSSNLRIISDFNQKVDNGPESFRWTTLRNISERIFNNAPAKTSVLPEPPLQGTPTVLAANGLVCIGTDKGHVYIFDFMQRLVCTCGSTDSANQFGSVTALALSHDHTFIAVGHIWGHIQLFDIKYPDVPARTVMPTNLAMIASGRQEGHILGSRIVALGFISGRHTAFVSADDQGLAFYHSLGKVLFMEAKDCLRLLGRYPEEDLVPPIQSTKKTGSPSMGHMNNGAIIPYPLQTTGRSSTILAMVPLPLGTAICPTDSYHLIAILTPIKLVIVGLRPSAKTRFRRHREGSNADDGSSRWRGCLAWLPSLSVQDREKGDKNKHKKPNDGKQLPGTLPMLAYSWGPVLHILQVSESRSSQKVLNDKTGKVEELDIGKTNFTGGRTYTSQSDILAVEWLNANQLIVLTDYTLEVLDARLMGTIETIPYDTPNIVSPTLAYTMSGATTYQDAVRDIQHSVRVYKSKIFILGHGIVVVGTLLTWADRILSYVEHGDFLSAIRLSRDYYLGQAKGNKSGLPEDAEEMKRIVGEKMSELMVASARYTFSEDRMTDSTHVTADNRGVDRTSLFEDLVSTCAYACIALDDFDFLFEDLFQYYDNSGILPIYLRQLEPFILDSSIRYAPPRITQHLVGMHDASGKPEAAERLIWHIDPCCLDINQSLTLCHKYQLYEALVYIYNNALSDYITPMVELLGLVRKVQQVRRENMLGSMHSTSRACDVSGDKRLELNAYKIFPYLSSILTGLTYPSDVPLPIEEAQKAQTDVYSFLFYGRSMVWPSGEGGKLILTADEEGGIEPTYPYARLLLRFDAEAFLHTLDLAFEQSYLNDETHGASRQSISKILLDIVATSGSSLSTPDVAFVNIFIARNVPKYPQFIHIAPSSLQQLLIGLASYDDKSTTEDRQLAAEYLLSAYTPHDSDFILNLFEKACFFRILRSWYHQERQWSNLLRTYLNDTSLSPHGVFEGVEQTLSDAFQENKGVLPYDAISALMDSLSLLLPSSTPRTALLVDKYAPTMHPRVLDSIGENNDYARFSYLRCLLGPPDSGDENSSESRQGGPSPSVTPTLRNLYLKLLCRLQPTDIIASIAYLPREAVDVHDFGLICEEARAYDAVIWLLHQTKVMDSFSRLETFSHMLTVELLEELLRLGGRGGNLHPISSLQKLEALYHMGIRICQSHSQQSPEANVPLEDLWFTLLSSQIDAVQSVSATVCSTDRSFFASDAEKQVLDSLRSHIQYAFTSLVTASSRKAVSFPRLFKRLVDATAQSRHAGVPYAEFRSILTSMLDSYRSEGELLVMGRRIIDSDFFDMLEVLIKERTRGWQAVISRCSNCKKPSQSLNASKGIQVSALLPAKQPLVVTRSGIFHYACYSCESDTHIG